MSADEASRVYLAWFSLSFHTGCWPRPIYYPYTIVIESYRVISVIGYRTSKVSIEQLTISCRMFLFNVLMDDLISSKGITWMHHMDHDVMSTTSKVSRLHLSTADTAYSTTSCYGTSHNLRFFLFLRVLKIFCRFLVFFQRVLILSILYSTKTINV